MSILSGLSKKQPKITHTSDNRQKKETSESKYNFTDEAEGWKGDNIPDFVPYDWHYNK